MNKQDHENFLRDEIKISHGIFEEIMGVVESFKNVAKTKIPLFMIDD